MKPGTWLASAWLALAPAAAAAQTSTFMCHSSFFVDAQTALTAPVPYANFQTFGDVDGDGVPDWVAINGVTLAVAYRNADGSTRATASFANPDMNTQLGGAALGDLDGVNGQEIVAHTESRVFVLKAGSGGALGLLQEIAVDPQSFEPLVAIGRFRGQPQAAIALETSNGTVTLESWGSGRFNAGPTLAIVEPGKNNGPMPPAMIAADVDGDGADDLLFPSAGGIGVARLGASAWQTFNDFPTGGPYYTLAAADFDGNGKTDVVALLQGSNAFMPPMRTWLQSAGGTFTMPADVDVEYEGSPFFTGDLSGDGIPELIASLQSAQLLGGAWQLLRLPMGFQVNGGLLDWNGDGLLDVVGLNVPDPGVLPGAWADLAVAATNLPASVPAGQPVSLTFAVTNNGPSPTVGLSLTGSQPAATFTVPACVNNDCSTLALIPGQTVPVTVGTTVPGDQFTFTVSACSTLFDRVPGNDSATVTIPVDPRADLGVLLSFAAQNGQLDIAVEAGNSGPSAAANVSMAVTIPPGVSGLSWRSSLAGARCSQTGNTLTCTLTSLPPMQNWSITTMGGFPYSGQSITASATVNSDTVDPNPHDNTYSFTLPAIPIGGTVGAAASSGCGCGLGDGGPSTPAAWLAIAALLFAWLGRRREALTGIHSDRRQR
jgi:MYXO-CTERM domain-containing protein